MQTTKIYATRDALPPFTLLITAFCYNVTWIWNWSEWESVSLDIGRDLSMLTNEKTLICDLINASAREIIGNNCRGHSQRIPVLFRGFNDIDDGTISRSTIIAVMKLPLLFSREQESR